jgi:hypothetical protein
MAIAELTDKSTTEEVNSYVEQVVEEVKADRAGTEKAEPKGDARIASEHANNEHKPEKAKEIPAEEKSGSKKPAESKDPAESGDEESSAEWMDEDLKAEVAAYGIEESDLADYSSREELERAMRLFDKSALAAGKKALAEADGRNVKGQFLKKEAEAPVVPKAEGKPEAQDGKYEPKLDKAVYDEEIVNEFTRMRDHYESRLERLETHFQEQAASAEEKQFDSAIDKLDMPKLFGVTGKETPAELKKREEVMAQAKVLQAGYRSFGRDVEIESLVGRAAPMVFATEFGKQDLKNRTRKISRQSNGRQGGGATKPQDPREDPREEADREYRRLVGS